MTANCFISYSELGAGSMGYFLVGNIELNSCRVILNFFELRKLLLIVKMTENKYI
jgi:hypothetical protein